MILGVSKTSKLCHKTVLTMKGTLTMLMRMKSLSRQVKMFFLLWGMVERKARRVPPRRKTSKEEMVATAQEKTIPAVIAA